MDIHVAGPDATPDERAAVDALLGPPEGGWDGGVRDAARDGRSAHGGRPASLARNSGSATTPATLLGDNAASRP